MRTDLRYSSWALGRFQIFRSPGWVGIKDMESRRYYVLRDTRRHPPLFSERYGYSPFHVWVKVGRWELGWK